MNDTRQVLMNAEQAQALDELVIPALMRANYDDQATALMSLALQWRFSRPIEPPLPNNVVEFEQWSKRAAQ